LFPIIWISHSQKPNIVFVLIDDQDVLMDSLKYMPLTTKALSGEEGNGITFQNGFVTTPVCCPSRSALLSGRLLHNNLALNNSLAGGCSSRKWQTDNELRATTHFLLESI